MAPVHPIPPPQYATQRCVGSHPNQHNCVDSHPNWGGMRIGRGPKSVRMRTYTVVLVRMRTYTIVLTNVRGEPWGTDAYLHNCVATATVASPVPLWVGLRFILGQHSRDEALMTNLSEYLGCGSVYMKDACSYVLTKFSDIENKIIPFFHKYPILGVKSKDFQDFCRVANMMSEKKHLTADGLEQIRKIKSGMNSGRK